MAQAKDVSDQVFGRLTAIQKEGRDKFGISLWRCKCSCGRSVIVRLGALTSGGNKSCGCLNQEIRSSHMMGNTYAKTHNLSSHPLYQTWSTMKQRCQNPKQAKYYLYGGRGISVCPLWIDSFETFLKDVGERPEGCTLDRKDSNGNYCKDNCKWSTHSEQNRNRRTYARIN